MKYSRQFKYIAVFLAFCTLLAFISSLAEDFFSSYIAEDVFTEIVDLLSFNETSSVYIDYQTMLFIFMLPDFMTQQFSFNYTCVDGINIKDSEVVFQLEKKEIPANKTHINIIMHNSSSISNEVYQLNSLNIYNRFLLQKKIFVNVLVLLCAIFLFKAYSKKPINLIVGDGKVL